MSWVKKIPWLLPEHHSAPCLAVAVIWAQLDTQDTRFQLSFFPLQIHSYFAGKSHIHIF